LAAAAPRSRRVPAPACPTAPKKISKTLVNIRGATHHPLLLQRPWPGAHDARFGGRNHGHWRTRRDAIHSVLHPRRRPRRVHTI
jgi:hypothetical protein